MPSAEYSVVDRESVGGGDLDDASSSRSAATARPVATSAGMGVATLDSCVVALTNTILGSGMLGLPHAFAACGCTLSRFLAHVNLLAPSSLSELKHLGSAMTASDWRLHAGTRLACCCSC